MNDEEDLKRFKQLLRITSGSLNESHSSINIRALINECYREDASMFDSDRGSGVERLSSLLDGVLNNIDLSTETRIRDLLTEQRIADKLNLLDKTVDECRSREEKEIEKEEVDKLSAQEALRYTKFPEIENKAQTAGSISMGQVYRIKAEMRERLLADIERVESDMEKLERNVEHCRNDAQQVMDEVQKQRKIMADSADMCSHSGMN